MRGTEGKKINKRAVGTAYEKLAGEYLIKQGYEVLEYNFRCRMGEIDLVAKDREYLVFVEVKYRSSGRTGFNSSGISLRLKFTNAPRDLPIQLTC